MLMRHSQLNRLNGVRLAVFTDHGVRYVSIKLAMDSEP